MMRKLVKPTLVLVAGLVLMTGCVSPFSDHAKDVRSAWSKKLENAHRRWDKYVLDLDWDDPYHDWHDESYARGPRHR